MSIETDFELIKKYDNEYCMQVFAPLEISFVKGSGVYLTGTDKKKYMDMIGGIAVNTLGHNNKALTKTIAKQASKLIHCSNYYYIAARSELAFNLCRLSFADKVFFSNSGAEANEAAIKLARGYFHYKGEDRYEIITANMSFHGRTMATIAATGQEKFRKAFAPNTPGFKYVDFNDIDQLTDAISDKTAAVMLELVQGESGVHPADKEYIKKVRSICNDKGILLIVDEVQTGMGRTGRMFCYQNYDICPDIMTLAKGLAGGVPIGATLCTDKVATGFKIGDHGSTFGGNPLACAAANTVIEQFADKDLLANVNATSKYIFDQVTTLKNKYNHIKQVRGIGLLIGIEFNDSINAGLMRKELFNKGFLVSAIGKSTIRIAPPLILKTSDAKKFIKALNEIFKSLKKNPSLLEAPVISSTPVVEDVKPAEEVSEEPETTTETVVETESVVETVAESDDSVSKEESNSSTKTEADITSETDTSEDNKEE